MDKKTKIFNLILTVVSIIASIAAITEKIRYFISQHNHNDKNKQNN